jgi:hypothetical protein
VTVSLLSAPVAVHGIVDLPALAFGFNSRRRITILFPVFQISPLTFLGIRKNINFPRSAGKQKNNAWKQLADTHKRMQFDPEDGGKYLQNVGNIVFIHIT